MLEILDRGYLHAEAGRVDGETGRAFKDAFDAAVEDKAFSAEEVTHLTALGTGFVAPATLTGDTMTAAIAAKRAAEEAKADQMAKAAERDAKREAASKSGPSRSGSSKTSSPKSGAPAERAFASWEFPTRIVARAESAGWKLDRCSAREDPYRADDCEFKTGTHHAEVSYTRYPNLDSARYREHYSREGGDSVARDGRSVLTVAVWATADAAALLGVLVPPGTRLQDLGPERIKEGLRRQGWESSDCTTHLDEADSDTDCELAKNRAQGSFELDLNRERGDNTLDEREQSDGRAWVRQEDGRLTLRLQDAEAALKLFEGFFAVDEAVAGGGAPAAP